MMREMSWFEYQLHARFVQQNPWHWGMVVDDKDGDEEAELEPKKELSDEEYRKIVIEDTRARS